MMRVFIFSIFAFIIFAGNAWAYVGPGLGLGVVGALVGLIVAVFLSIVGLVWYPVKRLLKKFRFIKSEKKSTIIDEKASE